MGKDSGAALRADEVEASWKTIWGFSVKVFHHLAQAAADRVSDHRRAHLSRQCVRHLGRAKGRGGQKPDPEQSMVSANTIGTQPSKRRASSKPLNQADSLLRPRRRRALIIARPLLVIIRCRNP